MSDLEMASAEIFPALDLSLLDLPSTNRLGLSDTSDTKPRILLLYGSNRERSFSRLLTQEAARLLQRMGAETVIFDPSSEDAGEGVPAVQPEKTEGGAGLTRDADPAPSGEDPDEAADDTLGTVV